MRCYPRATAAGKVECKPRSGKRFGINPLQFWGLNPQHIIRWKGDDPTERVPYLVEINDNRVYNPQNHGECEYNASVVSPKLWDLFAELGFGGREKVLPVLNVLLIYFMQHRLQGLGSVRFTDEWSFKQTNMENSSTLHSYNTTLTCIYS